MYSEQQQKIHGVIQTNGSSPFQIPKKVISNHLFLVQPAEVRMCIQANTDWWRLEFTLKDGTDIFYRENNAVNSGWTDMGSEYSVTGKSGQKIYLNFASGTGEVK